MTMGSKSWRMPGDEVTDTRDRGSQAVDKDEDVQESKRVQVENVEVLAENDDAEEEWAYDDVNGKVLDFEKVKKWSASKRRDTLDIS